MIAVMRLRSRSYMLDAIEEEEWDKVRLGYLSSEDERMWEDAFHSSGKRKSASFNRFKEPSWRRHVMESRTRLADRETGYIAHRREVIVKAVSRAKSIGRVQNMLKYTEQPRERDGEHIRPVLQDEFGRPTDEWRDHLEGWGLLNDNQNRVQNSAKSLSGNRAVDHGREHGLHYVQAHHLVISIDARDDDPDDIYRRLDEAVYLAIDSVFTRHGFRVLWAVHADTPSHPHVHIVVKAQPHRGRRLRFDKQGDYLHYLRLVFARSLSDCGLPCQATRRVDRSALRRHILQGSAPLSENITRGEPSSPKLSERAPNWWRYLEWRRRKEKDDARCRLSTRKPGFLTRIREGVKLWQRKRASPPDLEPPLEYHPRMMSSAALIYTNPLQAVETLLGFCIDEGNNLPMARWLVRHAPGQFGDLREDWQLHPEAPQCLQHEVLQIGDTLNEYYIKDDPKNEVQSSTVVYEQNQKRVAFQRRAVAHQLMRLAAYSRDVFRDDRLAYGIRWELTDSLRTAGHALRVVPKSTQPKSPMIKHTDKGLKPGTNKPLPSTRAPSEARAAATGKTPRARSSSHRRRGYQR